MICRLCLLESLNYIEIFGKKGCEMKIASLIAEHFWFTLKEDDCTSKMICSSCWHKTKDFHEFYLNIKEAQERLSTQTTNVPAFPEIVSIKVEVDDWTRQGNIENVELSGLVEDACKTEDSKNILIPEIEVKEEDPFNNKNQENSPDTKKRKLRSRKEDIKRIKNANKLSRRNTDSLQDVESKSAESDNGVDCYDDTRTSDDNLASDEVLRKRKYQEKKQEDDEKITKFMKLECNWCRFEGKTFASIKKHCRKEHKQDGFIVCCQKKFLEKRHLIEHVNLHLNPEDFTCQICDRTFAYMHSFKNHMTQHNEEKPFKCDKCPKVFANQVALKKHTIVHIPAEERQYFCDQCSKTFPSKNRLDTHQKLSHGNAYNRICDICGKVVRGKTLFDEHQRQHAGVVQPKVQCPHCSRWYKSKHSLRNHIKRDHTETTETELICDICGEEKPSKESLRRHKKNKHFLLNSLQCSLCNRTLNSPIALKEHMTTHTGESLYTCPYCPKTFSFNAALHLHRKNVHPKEWEESRKKRIG